jgi:hypothetical protein
MADQVFAAALADAKQNLPKIADELDPEKYGIVLSVSGPVVIAERMSGAAMYELVGQNTAYLCITKIICVLMAR